VPVLYMQQRNVHAEAHVLIYLASGVATGNHYYLLYRKIKRNEAGRDAHRWLCCFETRCRKVRIVGGG
jgi:hypothetical protein